MLAGTYDPQVLGSQDLRSVTPDPAAARLWYQKAAQLGSADARRRLGQIAELGNITHHTTSAEESPNATSVRNGIACHDDGLRPRRPGPSETEYDPAKVSESLKAIFQFGSVATKQALNANTVTLMSGTIGGTYVQFGADLASVLDDGNKLRVLPIVGRGSVQSVADILFLQGVDLGIVRADTLDYLERKGFAKDIKKQFTYVTKLYNEEMYVIASKSIRSSGISRARRSASTFPMAAPSSPPRSCSSGSASSRSSSISSSASRWRN